MSKFVERFSKMSAPRRQRVLEEMSKLGLVEPVAIIGIGCRFPGGANNPDKFWELLKNKIDTTSEVPLERWDNNEFYNSDPSIPGKINTRYGAFIDKAYEFDASFFGISPREAIHMDPQQRLLLEVVWEALEDARQHTDKLKGSQTGVFIGIATDDYGRMQLSDPLIDSAYIGTGSTFSIAANRISYVYDFHGPSVAIDTACSSSLVAIHLACQSLLNKESNLALAGGVNLILSPGPSVNFTKAGFLAPDGKCKAFDSRANGYVRGEGAGIVVLKRLSQALEDQDPIYAVVRATAVNQDGRTNGLTAPNQISQEDVLQAAYKKAGISPGLVSYIEAHGTGTALGDPIEAKALGNILKQDRLEGNKCAIGSVKTNIGHLEAAAGIAGIIKVALSLKNRMLVPSLNFEKPNPFIPFDKLPLKVQQSVSDWPQMEDGAIAGVNSFGFGGTNAHVILEEFPLDTTITVPSSLDKSTRLLLSGQTQEALKQQAQSYLEYIEAHPEIEIADICHSTAIYRKHFSHRLVAQITEKTELINELKTYIQIGNSPSIETAQSSPEPEKIAFLFTGQGSQYAGMAKELYENVAIFRETLDKCAEITDSLLDHKLLSLIFADKDTYYAELLNHTKYTQVAIFAIEYSLYEMWKSFGLTPSALLGHSIGEIVAVTCAGVFSLEDGLKIAIERGKLMGSVAEGSMLSLDVDKQEALELIKPYKNLSIAGLNSPSQTVISGQNDYIEALIATLKEKSIKYKKLKVSHAFHSSMMDSILDKFGQVLENVSFNEPSIAIASNLTGKIEKEVFTQPHYWINQLRQCVNFEPAIKALADYGVRTFVEIGSQAILSSLASICLENIEDKFSFIASLKTNQSDTKTLLQSATKLWLRGFELNWESLLPGKAVALPTYPFQRQRFYFEPKTSITSVGEYELSGQKIDLPAGEFIHILQLSPNKQIELADHKIHNHIVLAGTYYLAILLAVAQVHWPKQAFEIKDVQFLRALIFDSIQTSVNIQVNLKPEGENGFFVTLSSQHKDIWVEHIQAYLFSYQTTFEDLSYKFDFNDLDLPNLSLTTIDAMLQASNAEWGNNWWCIEQALESENSIFSRYSVSKGGRKRSLIDAKVIDNAFVTSLAIASKLDNQSFKEGIPFLPFTIERFSWYGDTKDVAWVESKLIQSTKTNKESTISDLYFWDELGQPLAKITGFTTRKAPVEQFLSKTLSGQFYLLDWQKATISVSSTTSQDKVVILTKELELATNLKETLENSFNKIELYQDFTQLASASFDENNIPNIIVVSFINDKAENTQEAEIASLALLETQRTVKIIQDWLQEKRFANSKLVILTQRAFAIGNDYKDLDLIHSPLWGLINTLENEYTTRNILLLDIDSSSDLQQITSSILSSYKQLAVRNNQVLYPVVKPTKVVEHSTKLNLEGTILITGGLGSLGKEITKHLIKQGAKSLLLISRQSSETTEPLGFLKDLQPYEADVKVVPCDVTNLDSLAKLINSLPENKALKGVIHCAGLLDDAFFLQQTPERLEKVMSSKIIGAWNLHLLTKDRALEFFLMFSSLAGMLGNIGQANYSAANSFLDSLACYRNSLGLPAKSLAWGPWAEVGMAARLSTSAHKQLEEQGLFPIALAEGLNLFDIALTRPEVVLAPASINLSSVSTEHNVLLLLETLRKDRTPIRGKHSFQNTKLQQQLVGLSATERELALIKLVSSELEKVLHLSEKEKVDINRPFMEMGLDSLMAVELRERLSKVTGLNLPTTLAFDYPTVKIFAKFLEDKLQIDKVTTVKPKVAKRSRTTVNEPIAIVSAACRFPGGVENIESFWQLLTEGRDAITEVPKERWDIDAYYDSNQDEKGKTYTRWGGFIGDVTSFDASFFAISPREAISIDPQERLLLETSWEALENAAIMPQKLMGSNTGVYVGICGNEYLSRVTADPNDIDAYSLLGTLHSAIVGRLSYFLGLKGPNFPVDTACSSSLVALHLACQGLRQGECDAALVGGVNLIIAPEGYIYFSKLKALSPTGKCHTFSSDADGYVRAEGCGMLYLKRLSDAQRDGNPILAVIRATAINQDGRSNGLTAPNGPSQEAVIRAALSQADIEASSISYVECHGTGTPLGDPIEVQSLAKVYSETSRKEFPLYIGSVKTNIGHTEGAAGIAGVIKTALCLHNKKLVKNLHFSSPNPLISWAEMDVEVVKENIDWLVNGIPRRAGVSSFGFSGTNAHVILEEVAENKEEKSQEQKAIGQNLLLSAQSEEALKDQARCYAKYIEEHPKQTLNDICHSAVNYRNHFVYRLSIQANEAQRDFITSQLKEYAAKGYATSVETKVLSLEAPQIAFLFTGQGSQYSGMAKELYDNEDIFRESLNACAKIVDPILDYSLLSLIFSSEGSKEAELLHQTKYTQVSLFAIEYSLYQMWKAFGITPAALLGHSIGELVAAVCAGVFSLEDGLKVAIERGKLMGSVAEGSMLSLDVEEEKALELIKSYPSLSVAGLNSPNQTVVSGQNDDIEALIAILKEKSIKHKKLKVSHAFHSSMMDSILDDFEQVLQNIILNEPSIPIASNLTGKIEKECFTKPSYWSKQIRQSVRFEPAINALAEYGINTFIELGSNPVLTVLANQCLENSHRPFNFISSLKSKNSDINSLCQAIGKAWLCGIELDWSKILPGKFINLPTYPFQRKKYWIELESKLVDIKAKPLIYDIKWQLAQVPISLENSKGTWLVFSDNTTVSNELVSNLSAKKEKIILVKAGNSFTEESDNIFYINPNLVDDYLQLFEVLRDKNINLSTIVYLWLLDLNIACDSQAIFREGVLPLLNLVKSLAFENILASLCLVTNKAQSIKENQHVIASQRMFWGLGKVLAWEYPTISCKLIDLDIENINLKENISLFENLCTWSEPEPEIVLRNSSVYKARLEELNHLDEEDSIQVKADVSYLITGGIGSLGLALAKDLANRGARNLILLSRSGLNNDEQEKVISELRQAGVTVWTPTIDISNKEKLETLFLQINKDLPPLKGIVHAAGVIEQSLLSELTEEIWLKHTKAKVDGAINLHNLSLELNLDFFILYSSASAWLGLRQAGAYAAANAFLDGLAVERCSQNLPALSIAWGAWKDSKMSSQNLSSQSSANSFGIGSLFVEEGLKIFNKLGLIKQASIGVLPYNWQLYKKLLTSSQERLITELIQTEKESEKVQEPELLQQLPLQQLPLNERKAAITQLVRDEVARVLGTVSNNISLRQGFAEQGMDSLMSVELRLRLQQALNLSLSSTIALDYPNIEELSNYLFNQIVNITSQSVASTSIVVENKDEPIAIIGASCRFPGGVNSLESFWTLLKNGQDAVREVPPDRWNLEGFYDPDPKKQGMSYSKWGGFLTDIKGFDAAFFRILPREAKALDPQQRLLMEVSWEALENANIVPSSLHRSRTGVFVGLTPSTYGSYSNYEEETSNYVVTGNQSAFLAGRVAYVLGLQGPAIAIDTACSSSLVSLHLACQALHNGECDTALAGGVSLILSDESYRLLSAIKALSPTGRCHTFSNKADGYTRGEGCAIVVLKRLSDAQKAGDNVLAVIKATAINHDGPSSGLTVPSSLAQQAVISEALAKAKVAPSEVDYLECHGTGTELGDPIEVQAAAAIYGKERSKDKPLLLGTVKTNLGHLEAASGIAGVLKVVLALQNNKLPKNLHFTEPSSHINWAELPVQVNSQERDWSRNGHPRIAGVSSFGLSGTNAHVLIEEPPTAFAKQEKTNKSLVSGKLFFLSGQTQETLRAQAKQYADYIEKNLELDLSDLCYSAAIHRTHFANRASIVVRDREQLVSSLKEIASQTPTSLASRAEAILETPKVVFVYPGQGSQWLGMGRELLEVSEAFRKSIKESDEAIKKEAGFSIIEELLATQENSKLSNIEVVQPILFAMAVAITAVWNDFGVKADVVVGHSQGEVVAAYIAGILTLEDAVKVVCRRSKIVKQLTGQGLMAMLELTIEQTKERLSKPCYEGKVSIAVSNSPSQTVVSGESQSIEHLLQELEAEKVFCRKIQVDYASHSPQIDSIKDELLEELKSVTPRSSNISFISTVTKEKLEGIELTAEYWYRNLREPVGFGKVVEDLWKSGECVMIEQSSHPLLTLSMEEIRKQIEGRGVVANSLKKEQPQLESILLSLGLLHCAGLQIDWLSLLLGKTINLPTYPFQHQDYWVENIARKVVKISGSYVLSGERIKFPDGQIVHKLEVGVPLQPYIGHHVVYNTIVVPGAFHLATLLAIGEACWPNSPIELKDVQFIRALTFADATSQTTLFIQLVPEQQPDSYQVTISTQTKEEKWNVHAKAKLSLLKNVELPQQNTKQNLVNNSQAENYLQPLLNQREIEWGELWWWLQDAVKINDTTVYGRFKPPKTVPINDAPIPPGLIDNTFGLEAWLFSKEELEQNLVARLPFAVKQLQWFGNKNLVVAAQSKLVSKNQDSSESNITFWDESGQPVAFVKGFTTQKAPVEKFLSKAEISHLYKLDWISLPKDQQSPEVKECVVIGESWLAKQLNYKYFQDLEELFVYVDKNSPPEKIIIEVAVAETSDLALQAKLNTQTVLAQVQALLSREKLNKTELIWLTRNAVDTGFSEDLDLSLAPIWGLIRTVRNENPNRSIRLIDDGSINTELLQNAISSSEEPEIALRKDSILVPRLKAFKPTSTKDWLAFPTDMQNTESWQINIDKRGSFEGLSIKANPRAMADLEPNQVRIAIKASGINFRDVMNVLGLYPGDAGAFGGEGAGIVMEVGKAVKDFSPGDKVMGNMPWAFSTITISDSNEILPLPDGWSYEDGATVMGVFLTAWLGLVEIGKLKKGERLLIHTAAGGVGNAAIQIANYIGAEIFATAHPSKWQTLQDWGIDLSHISNSRTLEFEEKFLKATDGKGVNVVLHSLAGEFTDASLRLMAEAGRFLEMGKLDLRDPEKVKSVYPKLDYLPFDLYKHPSEKRRQMFLTINELFKKGILKPIPRKTWDLREIPAAMYYMMQAKHTGKIILRSPNPIDPCSTVLITGGTGDLGALAATHLVIKHQVKNLVLLSRQGLNNPESIKLKEKLEQSGARVDIFSCDIADKRELSNIIDSIPKDRPLKGVIHCAGLLNDTISTKMDNEKLAKALAPKVDGAWNLHSLTKDKQLDFFVMFSSTSGIFGSAGQSNYSAGNTFLDALAAYRQKLGLPAQSLAWGLWKQDGKGMTSHLSDVDIARIKNLGSIALTKEEGVKLLDRAILEPSALFVLVNLNLQKGVASVPALLRELAKGSLIQQKKESNLVSLKEKINKLPEQKKFSSLLSFVTIEIAMVMSLNISAIPAKKPLKELGLDSLLAIEIKNRLSAMVGEELPATLLFDYPSAFAITQYLFDRFFKESLSANRSDVSSSYSKAHSRAKGGLKADNSNLSDEEIKNILSSIPISSLRENILLEQLIKLSDYKPKLQKKETTAKQNKAEESGEWSDMDTMKILMKFGKKDNK